MKAAKQRQVHSPEFKAKVGLEALRGMKAVNEIGQEYGVHPGQIGLWKMEIQEQAKTLFEGKRDPKPVVAHQEPELRAMVRLGRTALLLRPLFLVRLAAILRANPFQRIQSVSDLSFEFAAGRAR
jgi:transposase-like protein